MTAKSATARDTSADHSPRTQRQAVDDTAPGHACLCYNQDQAHEYHVSSLEDLLQYKGGDCIVWLHCEQPDTALITAICQHFGVHTLVQEDIASTHKRSKFEEHDDYLFLIIKRLLLREHKKILVQGVQLSMLVFQNCLISFDQQSGPDEMIERLRLRILQGKGRLRHMGTDYLAYAIIDGVVDHYFSATDVLEKNMEKAEAKLVGSADAPTFALIQRLKRQLVSIRKNVSPLREVLVAIERSEHELISDAALPFFRSVQEHIIWVVETVDSYRDLINGMLDIHLTNVSNRTNEIMKVLTIFTSIFTPLTFIVGIYGMNFDFMPELHWKWAYPLLWLVFLLLPVCLFAYFRKRHWI
ncbi:MAG: magnesium/cobalt transporter CorA [Desulfobulbaceae bacterium]|nr:magnesium/cobalt transporter CorA [Desulfobulbaceae bacterium]